MTLPSLLAIAFPSIKYQLYLSEDNLPGIPTFSSTMRSPTTSTNSSSHVLAPRLCLVLLLGSALFFPSIYQPCLDQSYSFLYASNLYRLSTFETLWTVLCYAVIEPLYTYKFAHNPQLRLAIQNDKDSTNRNLPKLRRPSQRIREGITYMAPLLLLDLTMIKKFGSVPVRDMALSGNYDPDIVAIRGNFLAPNLHRFTLDSPMQTWRALPHIPPTSRQLVIQLAASFFIYDALFFLFHLALHKLPVLKQSHKVHHGHAEINPQITNQLDIVERLGLVLLANFSLNIIGSHVLTRTLFVPIFVWLLVEIHSGMDLEWGYDKLLPQGWAAGSKRHSQHHQVGTRYYAPFFNWWDNAYEVVAEGQKNEPDFKAS